MWLYNIAIRLYGWIIRLAALKSRKAQFWVRGRKGIFDRMREAINPADRIIWVHAASLGEFEQGRPLIEALRNEHPEYKICKVNVDAEGELAEKFGVMSIPTLFVLKNGEVVKTTRGAQPKARLLELFL